MSNKAGLENTCFKLIGPASILQQREGVGFERHHASSALSTTRSIGNRLTTALNCCTAACFSCKLPFYNQEDHEAGVSFGEMEQPQQQVTSAPLERSVSQQSTTSIRSHRSGTVRPRKRLQSQQSSRASSLGPESDKSLTSFPSFSPESPRHERSFLGNREDSTPSRKSSDSEPTVLSQQQTRQREGEGQLKQRPASIVDSLTTPSPPVATVRSALFDDAPPLATKTIPGALHHADDEHIQRLIARHGAVNLVRQIAEDLAQRDSQIASLRRRADERERTLRKIILECGLTNLDLETRLRAIEQEARNGQGRRKTAGSGEGLSDLMSDAMAEDVRSSGSKYFSDETIRASSLSLPATTTDADKAPGTNTTRGWKDYLWGTGTTKSSRASSIHTNGDVSKTVIRAAPPTERRPTLAEDLFNPPTEAESVRSSSRASSIHSGQEAAAARKASLASLALRLVAGGATVGREREPRRRANSGQAGGSLRTPSSSSVNTTSSSRVVSAQGGGPKSLMAMRRATGGGTLTAPVSIAQRSQPQERWDTMGSSPANDGVSRQESLGPVEMDTILPPEDQPPTLRHIYNYNNNNNYDGLEYLTDRFGFIYDQRRKKRQREAAQMARHVKRGSRGTEMLSNGRSGISPAVIDDSANSAKWDVASDGRPSTPSSTEESRDEAKPKRWQDYLKIATFPTELLSHTPSISVPAFDVVEGGAELPKSPGLVASGERGFIPPATTTTATAGNETPPVIPDPEGEPSPSPSGTIAKEDAEPVKLLLQNLSQLHDTLQREKTVRWNDFLRKVRAERRREGEAAAAAAAAAAETKYQRPSTVIQPEAKLGDGELIGVASLGIQGKVGRAKANEFKTLLLGGIPVAYRAKIWSECSGAKALRIPGYYEDLVSRPEDQDDPQIVAQIKADITRTLTDNIFFRKGPGVAKLHEVLLAYSRRNPEVGYCQGMNLVAANLLLMMPSAEDAFWILVSMVEHILPAGYFDHSLLASRADQQVLRQYVSEILPKLSQHFEDLSIDLETMTFQWFLSVFTDCLSAEALFRVWDVVLCLGNSGDGSTFLFQVALALLKLNEQQLLACESPAAVYTYINHQMTNHAISIDGLIQASEGLRRVVKREEVEQRREKAMQAERDQGRVRDTERDEAQVEEQVVKSKSKRRIVQMQMQMPMPKATTAPAVVSEETALASPSLSATASESGD
ncbi:TBC-domain-containing protein [Diplogelasinospora grovesii]|uniref:TBC-domain-containing protein n=1 Tax=Diplogelasinospora grovesii TaxID=303347 RepID=A0AAN6NB39_9PEZI|nr:TBC-domain-containing protein [Diplogelasinospora grovesii]